MGEDAVGLVAGLLAMHARARKRAMEESAALRRECDALRARAVNQGNGLSVAAELRRERDAMRLELRDLHSKCDALRRELRTLRVGARMLTSKF